MSVPLFKAGTYAGTTAAQSVNVGFAPQFIMGWNITDDDVVYFWNHHDNTSVQVISAAASANASTIATHNIGFDLPGSDSVVNENGKTYMYLAVKADL